MGIIYLDLETTGTKQHNSIIEIAAEYHVDGQRKSAYSGKCFDPDSVINLEALNVNKTKFSELQSRRHEKDILMGFFDWLLGIIAIDENIELTGINIQFDFNLLSNRAAKYSINTDGVLPYRLEDIGQLSRLLVKLGLLQIKKAPGKGNTLKNLCTTLEVDLGANKLHSAEGDVALYSIVHNKLMEILIKAIGNQNGQNQ